LQPITSAPDPSTASVAAIVLRFAMIRPPLGA
jgi:hypothetical protein